MTGLEGLVIGLLALTPVIARIAYVYHRGFSEAYEWHADGADIETLEEMGIGRASARWFGWAFRWGWRTYCREVRKCMKIKA